MKRRTLGVLLGLTSLLVGCTRTVHEEFELLVEALPLSDLYGGPPNVSVALTGW